MMNLRDGLTLQESVEQAGCWIGDALNMENADWPSHIANKMVSIQELLSELESDIKELQ